MRNRLRPQGIEAPRGAYDGGGEKGVEVKVDAGGYATRVFCEKSVQVVEKKGRGAEKERKERKRVRKSMQGKDLRRGEWWRRRANMGEFTMTTATLSRHFIKPARSAE